MRAACGKTARAVRKGGRRQRTCVSATSPDPTVEIGVQNNAPGAKDPCFDRVSVEGKR